MARHRKAKKNSYNMLINCYLYIRKSDRNNLQLVQELNRGTCGKSLDMTSKQATKLPTRNYMFNFRGGLS
jgi:hypothetical protein